MKRLLTLFVAVLAFGALMANPTVEPLAADTVPQAVQSRVRQQEQPQFVAVVEGNVLHITGVADGCQVQIYSITGSRVGTYTLMNGQVNLPDELGRGIYIVRANNHATKIVIR